jgi:hypothetical protein
MTEQLQLDLDADPHAGDITDEEPEPVIPRPAYGQLTELPGTTWEDIFR